MRKKPHQVAVDAADRGFEVAGERLIAAGRTAWLVGLGLAATAGEKSVTLFDELVEKGRHRRDLPFEKAQRLLNEKGAEILRFAEGAGRRAQKQAEALLGEFGLPSRAEVRELARRVEALRQRLV